MLLSDMSVQQNPQVLSFLSHPCNPSIIKGLRTLLRNGRPLTGVFSVGSALFLLQRGGTQLQECFDEESRTGQLRKSARCCAHQALHAAESAAMEAPVMSRSAWKTHPRVESSRVLSSVILSRSGTARSRCSRVSIPDCAKAHPPRSRTRGEGS